jgi:hypothetical protein
VKPKLIKMEPQNPQEESSLFGITIDPVGKGHLAEAAKWANFLAILGFIFLGLFVVMAIFGGTFLATTFGRNSRYNSDFGAESPSGFAIALIAYYLVVALLAFFAYLFLYRFAVNMKMALRTNSQDLLNRSFQNLKIMYRYIAILTIIGLSFCVLAILIGIIGAATT